MFVKFVLEEVAYGTCNSVMFGFFFFFKMKLALAFPTGNSTAGQYCFPCARFLLVLECLIGFRSKFYLSLVADEY